MIITNINRKVTICSKTHSWLYTLYSYLKLIMRVGMWLNWERTFLTYPKSGVRSPASNPTEHGDTPAIPALGMWRKEGQKSKLSSGT